METGIGGIYPRDTNWFENVMDSLPVGILIIERGTGNLLFVNKAAKDLAGGFYPMDISDDQSDIYATDAEGHRILKNDLPRFRVARGEKLYGHELTIHFKGGKITVVLHSGVIPATEHEPERIVIAVQEIEARKRWEENQKAVVKDLKEERILRESFVSSLTHDLRTPLSVARIHAEMISRKVDASLLPKCKHVIKSIDKVDRMIQDLLDANKLKAGEKLPIHPVDICLNDVVQEAVADFIDLFGNRFKVNGSEGIYGSWCAKSMRRILDNLIGNAVKYGDPQKPVEIFLGQDHLRTTLKVHNDGIPIPRQEQEKLFRPFKRARGKGERIGGWGIGLSLVKGLVEAHNGTVELTSNESDGTTFELNFPNRL